MFIFTVLTINQVSVFYSLYEFLLFNIYSFILLGLVKHFAGAICAHWTTENKTELTRVSLDFRLIDSNYYDITSNENTNDANKFKGYYNRCIKIKSDNNIDDVWQRDGPLNLPDARVGYPWTVNDWTKILKKKKVST